MQLTIPCSRFLKCLEANIDGARRLSLIGRTPTADSRVPSFLLRQTNQLHVFNLSSKKSTSQRTEFLD
jgi:hypothetical protein